MWSRKFNILIHLAWHSCPLHSIPRTVNFFTRCWWSSTSSLFVSVSSARRNVCRSSTTFATILSWSAWSAEKSRLTLSSTRLEICLVLSPVLQPTVSCCRLWIFEDYRSSPSHSEIDSGKTLFKWRFRHVFWAFSRFLAMEINVSWQ